jgi:hypothetical protein
VDRARGLFYAVLTAPPPAAAQLRDAFDAMIRSIRFER